MKIVNKIKYSAITLFAMISLSACITEPYDNSAWKLESAQLVYNQVSETLSSYNHIFDLAHNVDAYLQADGEVRDSIKFYALRGYDILERQDTVLVRNSANGSEFGIIRLSGDSSLSSEGAEWKITKYRYKSEINIPLWKSVIVIKNVVDSRQWSVKVNNYDLKALSDASLQVEKSISVDGAERYSWRTEVETVNEINTYPDLQKFRVSYQITDPFIFEKNTTLVEFGLSDYQLVSGVTRIEVDRGSGYEIDEIEAKIQSLGFVTLTFKGVTATFYYIVS